MKPRPRKTANLSESIHQQLSMYALAASAAGVGALCFAKPLKPGSSIRRRSKVHGPLD